MADNMGSSVNEDAVGVLKEHDLLLPIANVGRIMKRILPPNAKISKEAKETMQECMSEYISFVTTEASEKCRKERRKTVTSDDICWAMATLGFDDYVGPLKRYLERYRVTKEIERANQERSRDEVRSSYQDQKGTDGDEAEASGRSYGIERSNSSSYSARPLRNLLIMFLQLGHVYGFLKL